MKNRVVITGEGSISPLGMSSQSLWKNLINGVSGISLINRFDTEDLSVKIAGEVSDFNASDFFDRKQERKLDRYTMFALTAAKQAVKNANIESSETGVILGVGIGGMHTLEEQKLRITNKGQRGVSPQFIPKMIANIAGSQIAIEHGFYGPNYEVTTACSSATDAIGMAYNLIKSGQSDVIVSGGTEAGITPLTLSGFANMKALSTKNDNPSGASSPFDKNRDGFVLSEGAGILILESLEHAEKRNATILGEIIGYGCTNDAYHVTQPDNESKGATEAINAALKDADGQIEDNKGNVFGVTTFIDTREGYFEAGYGFIDDKRNGNNLSDFDHHSIAAAWTKRYGGKLSNSIRGFWTFGQSPNGGNTQTADGFAILIENSLITSKPSTLIPYANFFVGVDRPQPLVRGNDGLLKNTGIALSLIHI